MTRSTTKDIKNFLTQRKVKVKYVYFDDTEIVRYDNRVLTLHSSFRHAHEELLKTLARYLHGFIDDTMARETFEAFTEDRPARSTTTVKPERHLTRVKKRFEERFREALLAHGVEFNRLFFTNNRRRYLSWTQKDDIRLHSMFIEADDRLVQSLAYMATRVGGHRNSPGKEKRLRKMHSKRCQQFWRSWRDYWNKINENPDQVWLGHVTTKKEYA